MDTELRLRKNIAEIVRSYVDEYQSIHGIDGWWGKPLVGLVMQKHLILKN